VFSFPFMGLVVLFFLLLFQLFTASLRIGTLKINGGRDRDRRALLAELNRSKSINVFLSYKRHSSADNEVKWEMSTVLFKSWN